MSKKRLKINEIMSNNRPMNKTTALALTFAAATLLAGCDSARKALNQTKAAPDEFAVYTRAPLTMPPDYGLRPPSDGKTAEQGTVTTSQQARRILLGSPLTKLQSVQAATPGTSVILAMAGAAQAEPGIRDIVDRETSSFAKEDLRFMETLLYGDDPDATASVVDPENEAKRIQETQALGQPINKGDTPMIDANPKQGIGSIFGNWFN